jgi:hypothetical protein
MLILVQMALCLSSVWLTAVAISMLCCMWHYHDGTNHGNMQHTDLDLFGSYLLQSAPSHELFDRQLASCLNKNQ